MSGNERELQRELRQSFPLYEHVGLTVESARDGVYRCRVPLEEANRNHFGTVHAAIQWAAAEVLGGMVVMANFDVRGLFGAVRAVSIEFLYPAYTGVVAEARFPDEEVAGLRRALNRRGEAEFRLAASVHDERGNPVARSDARYVLRHRRAPGSRGTAAANDEGI